MGTPQIFDRLNACANLPSPPGAVIKLLELTRRPDVSAAEIADTIGLDPALSAKILRFVNSPLAGLSREVTSLQQAVALVGVRGVSTMALSLAIVSSDPSSQCTGFNSGQFAAQSVACGAAAKTLTHQVKAKGGQDAFLAGLLSQVGRVALACAEPEQYAKILEAAEHIPADLPELEEAAFGAAYPAIGACLLKKWNIPATISSLVETYQSAGREPSGPTQAKVLYVAELAAGVVCPAGNGPTGQAAEEFLKAAASLLGIDAPHCMEAIATIATETQATREVLELPPADIRSIAQIESDVRERLAELSVAMNLENQALTGQKEELIQRATTDSLTHVGNRAGFDTQIDIELERAVRSDAPFTLLMIDVDHFKVFNDRHGHQAGDRVLQAVARELDKNVRKIDYVARYGGEEFAVLAPNTNVDGAVLLAERLRSAVEELRVSWEDKHLHVTISLGACVVLNLKNAKVSSAVIQSADQQLYVSKDGGRNRAQLTTKFDATPDPANNATPDADDIRPPLAKLQS